MLVHGGWHRMTIALPATVLTPRRATRGQPVPWPVPGPSPRCPLTREAGRRRYRSDRLLHPVREQDVHAEHPARGAGGRLLRRIAAHPRQLGADLHPAKLLGCELGHAVRRVVRLGHRCHALQPVLYPLELRRLGLEAEQRINDLLRRGGAGCGCRGDLLALLPGWRALGDDGKAILGGLDDVVDAVPLHRHAPDPKVIGNHLIRRAGRDQVRGGLALVFTTADGTGSGHTCIKARNARLKQA